MGTRDGRHQNGGGEGERWGGGGFGGKNSRVVDAHCHLDRMLRELKVMEVSNLGLGQR